MDGFGAAEEDAEGGLLAGLGFHHDLAAGAAGGEVGDGGTVGVQGDEEEGLDGESGVRGAGGEECVAFGADAGGVGDVFLVAAGEDGAVGQAEGGADAEAGVGGVGAAGGVEGGEAEGVVGGGEFGDGAGGGE